MTSTFSNARSVAVERAKTIMANCGALSEIQEIFSNHARTYIEAAACSQCNDGNDWIVIIAYRVTNDDTYQMSVLASDDMIPINAVVINANDATAHDQMVASMTYFLTEALLGSKLHA